MPALEDPTLNSQASVSPVVTPDDAKTLVASSSGDLGLSMSEVNVAMTESASSRMALEVRVVILWSNSQNRSVKDERKSAS